MKYENKSNGVIAELVKVNEKFKTVDLLKEDGKETTISLSTFKRWWKQIPEEETTEEEVAKFVEASQNITKELNKNNSKSLVEMVEAQAEDVSDDVAPRTEEKSKKAKQQQDKKVSTSDVDAILDYISEVEKSYKATSYTRDKQPNLINVKPANGKSVVLLIVRQKKSVILSTKGEYLDASLKDKMTTTSQRMNKKLSITELSDENKELVDKIFKSVMSKEEK